MPFRPLLATLLVTLALPLESQELQPAKNLRRDAVRRYALVAAAAGAAAGYYFESSGMNDNCPECPVRWEGLVLSTTGTAVVGAAAGALTGALTHARLRDDIRMPSAETCTYDLCALRLANRDLQRGAVNQRVAHVGIFTAPKLVTLLASSSDSVLANARLFERDYLRSAPLLGWGSILYLAGLLTIGPPDEAGWGQRGDGRLVVGSTLMVMGAVMQSVGTRMRLRAHDALGRSIWWYNRDLPRNP